MIVPLAFISYIFGKFFIDFTENNEIVFKYAKEMKAPGPE